MKFIKGAGNLRPILGTQTFYWPLTHPPPPPGGGGFFLLQQWPALVGTPARNLEKARAVWRGLR